MPTEALITFVLASTVLALVPGPDNLFVLMQSALHGRRAGLLVTLGLCSGLVVHTTAVALGVAAIFLVNSLAFALLKFCGAAYLLFLAYKAWQAGSSELSATPAPPLSSWALYRRGVIMNISNPKVAIFFLAFLPQFVRAESENIPFEIMVLGLLFILVTGVIFGSVALLSGWLAGWLRSNPRAEARMQRITALVFAGLALRLALTTR